jgi:hypothetical protein
VIGVDRHYRIDKQYRNQTLSIHYVYSFRNTDHGRELVAGLQSDRRAEELPDPVFVPADELGLRNGRGRGGQSAVPSGSTARGSAIYH